MEPKEQDVKDPKDSSPEEDVKEPKDSSPEEEEVFEGEKRSIPYERFKEKVSEAKELKKMIENLQIEKDSAISKTAADMQAYYESEIAKLKRTAPEESYSYDLDDEPNFEKKLSPLMEEIRGLKQNLTEMKSERETERLKGQISTLKTVYPELEDEHVLVIKKARPSWSLEECAEYSHKYFEDKLKAKWSGMLAKKKEAAKKPVFREDGKLNIELPERPKSFTDAKKKMMEWAKQQDRLSER
jgi:hypothetical protein